MILDEIRQMVISIAITLILHDNLAVTRLPLLLHLNIPLFFDILIIKECDDTRMIFTASINVPLTTNRLDRLVFSFVAFIVDVVHGGICCIEVSIHLFPLVVTWLAIIT